MYRLLFILIILSNVVFSQNDTIAHLYAFGYLGNDTGEDIQATADGGYIAVGSTASGGSGNTDVYLLKVDSSCNYEWSTAIGGSNNDWGYSVQQTFDKGYIVASSSNSYGNGGYDAVLIKCDSLGSIQWQNTYGGNDWDFAYSVTQTYDSGYVFCGETYNNTNGLADVFVVKTDNLGDTLWTRTIGGGLKDVGNAIIEASDSSIVVAGNRNTITDSTQAYLIKLSPTGTLIWDSLYGGNGHEEIEGLIETQNNDYVMCGAIGNDRDYYLHRTDANGVSLWENPFVASGDEVAYDVVELNNGDLFFVGFTEATGNGGKDAKIFLITSGGWWGGQNSSFGGSNDDVIKNITFGLDGSMKMVGYTNSYGNGLNDLMIIDVDTVVPYQQFTVDTITDALPISISENKDDGDLLVYPNPASSVVLVKSSKEIIKIELKDIFGRVVKSKNTFSKREVNVNVSEFLKGIYIMSIYHDSDIIEVEKIIVQ